MTTKAELDRLIRQAQDLTGAPWLNGEAYAEYVGYPQKINQARSELTELLEFLRAEKNYRLSDRIRQIIARLS